MHGQLWTLIVSYASISVGLNITAGFSTLSKEADLGGQVADKALEPERPTFKPTFLLCDIGQIT